MRVKIGSAREEHQGKRGDTQLREDREVITQIQLMSDCCSIAVILYS